MCVFKYLELGTFFRTSERSQDLLNNSTCSLSARVHQGRACELFLTLSFESTCLEKSIWELEGKGIKEGRSPPHIKKIKLQTVSYIQNHLIDSYQNTYPRELYMFF